MSLKEYKAKRNFKKTHEPKGKALKGKGKKIFVVQKHHASHLHYDFRLELDGVLKSWAVPKGPSLNPQDKRLAVQVEDHPIDYANFEGEIPEGEYGAGHVIVWDKGEWIPPKNVEEQLKKGRLEFSLHGEKLEGEWMLLRTKVASSSKKPNWLLIKRSDEFVNTKKDITKEDESVLSGVSLEQMEHKQPKKKLSRKKSKVLEFKEIKKLEFATLVEEIPTGENWIHEIKYDGYRTLCRKDKKKVELLTRSGLNWTHKYESLKKEFSTLPVESIILDGEVVWLDEKGRSSFQGLQNALEEKRDDSLIYYAFDLLFLNGHDTRELPLGDRKKLLEEVLSQSDSEKIIFSHHWDENGKSVYKSACSSELEGIVSKNINSHYSSGSGGRSKNWLKIKCKNVQEFVIGGYTLQSGHQAIGALLVGAYNGQGEFQYVGRIGTGFDKKTHSLLLKKFKKIEAKKTPFERKSPKGKEIVWLKKKLVLNAEFSTWTDDQILRHAAFKGLREDKKEAEVYLEATLGPAIQNKEKFDITNPDKILYPEDKITKKDLVTYYEAIHKWMIPYVKDRPLAILRCPHGEGKECFFQKHMETDAEGILSKSVHSKLKDKKEEVLYIESLNGLVELVQLGTLEIHARGGTFEQIDFANQIVFDFDPGPNVTFTQVKKAAFVLKSLLEKLKLKSFVKTSGGKGLHVHVPVAPHYTWDEIKSFSKSICEQMEFLDPDLFTTTNSKNKRVGKIFLDYLRNGYGATAIAPYSVRARLHAPVALPISWEVARKLKSADSFTLKNTPALLKKRKDPWAGFLKLKQKINLLDKYRSAH